ncbi:hypothetical protein ACFYPA_28985 [Streptomyces sp. NPDC005775]|uniref:hypothetical protein n=1 Tax=Streptomyces sp. NPDC005775 TaxID=3364729 RepID=UPI0036CA082D
MLTSQDDCYVFWLAHVARIGFGKSAFLLWRVQMTGKLQKLVMVAVATVGMMAWTTSGSASAASQVPCNNSEFVKLSYHYGSDPTRHKCIACFAHAGDVFLFDQYARPLWADQIWTGNNRVQWFGDGRWQPAQPIGKNTAMGWSPHPGGVRIEKLRIV